MTTVPSTKSLTIKWTSTGEGYWRRGEHEIDLNGLTLCTGPDSLQLLHLVKDVKHKIIQKWHEERDEQGIASLSLEYGDVTLTLTDQDVEVQRGGIEQCGNVNIEEDAPLDVLWRVVRKAHVPPSQSTRELTTVSALDKLTPEHLHAEFTRIRQWCDDGDMVLVHSQNPLALDLVAQNPNLERKGRDLESIYFTGANVVARADRLSEHGLFPGTGWMRIGERYAYRLIGTREDMLQYRRRLEEQEANASQHQLSSDTPQ